MNRTKTKYNVKFDRVAFNNRWKSPCYSRNGDWVIIGFGKRYFGINELEYYMNFFGLALRFWFIRIPVKCPKIPDLIP